MGLRTGTFVVFLVVLGARRFSFFRLEEGLTLSTVGQCRLKQMGVTHSLCLSRPGGASRSFASNDELFVYGTATSA